MSKTPFLRIISATNDETVDPEFVGEESPPEKTTSPSNVHILPGFGDRDPDGVIEAARSARLKSVTIIGRDEEGFLFFSSSYSERPDVLWDLEWTKREYIIGD